MISLRLSQAADCVGATLIGADCAFRSVSVDTRTLQSGDVYFALTGDQFDGHEFVPGAVARGASAVVVERECSEDVPQLVVRNARQALGEIAALWLAQSNAKRVALTGSNGKTTVKEMLRSVLSLLGNTLATDGNLNNDVKPEIAVVNNVGPAHLDGFGSLQGVAAAKGEIFEHVNADGVAVVNLDEFAADDWIARTSAGRVVGFSFKSGGDLHAEVVADGEIDIVEAGETHSLQIPLVGEHNLQNALTVAAVCRGLGVEWSVIQAGLAAMNAVPGRLVSSRVGGVLILDDSYNANPASATAALKVLAGHAGGRRWCVMGEMAELGEDTADLHRKVGRQAAQLGIECFLSIGEHAVDARRGFGAKGVDYREHDALIGDLVAAVQPGDTVLVKGSRSAKMERVVDAVKAALEERLA